MTQASDAVNAIQWVRAWIGVDDDADVHPVLADVAAEWRSIGEDLIEYTMTDDSRVLLTKLGAVAEVPPEVLRCSMR